YSPNSVEMIKTRLRTLHKHGLVERDKKSTKFYNSPYYYTLSNKSANYLKERGADIPDSFRGSKEINRQPIFIQHTLEANDIYISAARLQAANPLYYLDEFIHERKLKERPCDVTWRGQTLRLIPDGFFHFCAIQPDGGERHKRFLLEHDCDTEYGEGFREKIRAWIAYMRAEKYQQHFGIKSVIVCFTTFKGEKRRDYMRRVLREELAGDRELCAYFLFTSQSEAPDPLHLWLGTCWYGPYDGPPVALLGGGQHG
ncbi:MAG TPA: replication-relaxation family protein, partial [Ktedonobacteraceae bacterium]